MSLTEVSTKFTIHFLLSVGELIKFFLEKNSYEEAETVFLLSCPVFIHTVPRKLSLTILYQTVVTL